MEELAISGNLAAEAIDFSLLSLFLRADLKKTFLFNFFDPV